MIVIIIIIIIIMKIYGETGCYIYNTMKYKRATTIAYEIDKAWLLKACLSNYLHRAVASMRPTEALASVKFWRISPIIFILHKRSSDIFNASWYYKEFSNSVNILWKNYHIIDLKGLRTLTQIFFEQILIKTIGEVNGHPDYVACFWLLLFKFHLN